MFKIKKILVLIFILLNINGCSSVIYKSAYPTLNDGKYDSEFPYKGSSQELEKIGKTVNRINCIAFYKAYIFNYGTNIKREQLTAEFLDKNANSTGYFDKTSSGTATTIFSENAKVGMLTCAHVVTFPDTILSYFTDADGRFTEYLESVSIRDRQLTYVAGFPGTGEVEIIKTDKEKDLAFLGKEFSKFDNTRYPVFPYPPGKAKELEWGSFVYVMGYPMNFKMVSKAIVSSPNMDGKGGFLLDAVVNRGFSGGVVLGIRDGIPNFELLGLIRSVPEEVEYILQPEKLKSNAQYSPVVPYRGEAFAIQKEELRYGIARVVPIEIISEFLSGNSEFFSEMGYIVKNFF